jgi:hypothetical protein
MGILKGSMASEPSESSSSDSAATVVLCYLLVVEALTAAAIQRPVIALLDLENTERRIVVGPLSRERGTIRVLIPISSGLPCLIALVDCSAA